MAKVPKHRRIKRATVLIKRTRCIKNTKSKSYSPLYQKLKVNNHLLARALSQEKQESQLLFSRNVELLAEVQDLVHACNNRDLVITNVLKNAKDIMQMLVKMSGFLTNTISSCQEFVSNQVNTHRTSTSSTGRRESTRRMSTKSPARGVVKPMVSGHTITKPTINLSRVNMQRLQNVNLSIIEEGSASPERNLDRSAENRHSRTLPERLPIPALRAEENEERVLVNRRPSKFSGGRLSSGRYSKRNSGRLSSGGLVSRLSKRSSEYSELIKSPRVTLQDVSRYLTNNQTVNIRLLSETTSANQVNNTTAVEDSQINEHSSPEKSNHCPIIPETQDSCETSEDSEPDNSTLCSNSKKLASSLKNESKRSLSSKTLQGNSLILESHLIDPLEGPSWMHNSSMETDETELAEQQCDQETSSPVSSLPVLRRKTYFRVPELPKTFTKPNQAPSNLNDNYNSTRVSTASRFEPTTSMPGNDDEEDDVDDDNDNDDEDRRVNLRFITQRRGPSAKVASFHGINGIDVTNDEEDDEDDDTLMLNIQRQLRSQHQAQPMDRPERLQFDLNELLQLTPLKSLQKINTAMNNGPLQVDVEPEHTATVQLTSRLPRPSEIRNSLEDLTTLKMYQNGHANQSSHMTVRGPEPCDTGNKSFSELTTQLLSSRIELPRLTDIFNLTENKHRQTQVILTPEHNKQQEVQKRKRIVMKSINAANSASEDNTEELPVQIIKKPKQRKKKSKDKDPCTAKVVLQKLNETRRVSIQSEAVRSDRKSSDESARSSVVSRAEQSSDSESSSASFSSKQIPMRPRRQKAPKNLQEPSLSRKLRR